MLILYPVPTITKGTGMAIKSSAFGCTSLTGEDAIRFIVHINEDKANPKAQRNLIEGRKLRASMRALQSDNQG